MKHPNPLMLVRIAQGDAFGMATEYIKFPRDQAILDKALQFQSYVRHPTHKLAPGQYTDDTQMSVAVTEVLLSLPEDWKSPFRVAEGEEDLRISFTKSFVSCFKRDQREGYSRGFQALLEQVKDWRELLDRIQSDSDKNGAAMRAVPIGVLADPEDVRTVAIVQARITHDTLGGKASSVAVALMSHYALHREGSLQDMPAWLDQEMRGFAILEPWPGGPVQGPGVGLNTARAVMTLLTTERTLQGIARKTLEWGGDTDSVLAIAWGIASTRMHDELPPFFDGGLENGPYGRKFLADLGARLMEKFSP